MKQRRDPNPPQATRNTVEARQAVAGHNVRYVLAAGLAGVIILFVAIGLLVP